MTPLRVSILIIAGILFAISLALLGLIGHEFAYINSSTTANAKTDFIDQPQYEDWPETLHTFASLPGTVDDGSLGMMIAAACGGTLDSLLIIALAFRYEPFKFGYFGRKVGLCLDVAAVFNPEFGI